MSDPLQKIRILARAEAALLKIRLLSLARQTILCAAGLLLLLLTVAMVNVAMYLFLEERLEGPVAALIVAGINALLAVIVFLMAKRTRPAPEAAVVEEIRDIALAELQSDVDAMKRDFGEAKADLQRIRSGFSGVFGSGGPIGGLMHLGPLLDMLTSSFKRLGRK